MSLCFAIVVIRHGGPLRPFGTKPFESFIRFFKKPGIEARNVHQSFAHNCVNDYADYEALALFVEQNVYVK